MTDGNKEIIPPTGDVIPPTGDANELDKLKADYDAKLEALKKELSTRDASIHKINKEKEAKELASKTAEEQAEIFRKKAEQLERKEAYRQSLKEAGLDADKFLDIINETDPKTQASKFAEILVEKSTQSANEALEAFKKENLQKIPPEASPKGGGVNTLEQELTSKGLI